MIGFEICQKLIYMIRDNQIESEWHPSVYAALDGIAGVVGGIEDNDIGAAISELVIKDLLQSMVTGVLICCPEHESRTTPLGEDEGVNLMSKIVRILAPKLTEDTAEDLRQTMWKMFTGCVISKGQGMSVTKTFCVAMLSVSKVELVMHSLYFLHYIKEQIKRGSNHLILLINMRENSKNVCHL